MSRDTSRRANSEFTKREHDGCSFAAVRVLFAVLALAASFGALPEAGASASHPAPPPRFLVSHVRGWIARSHSARPVKAWFVLTRREPANEVLSGASVNSNQPVYVVVIKGAFTVPRPGPAAQGSMHVSVLNSVIDARTGRETDGGLGRSMPDLARLGKVRDLLPYLRRR